MDLGLSSRTALITGASEGIGRAIALRFAREGANIVACARREEPLRQLSAELEDIGAGVVTVACDVTDLDAPARILDAAKQGGMGIDILVNNAGKATPVKFLDTTEEDWSEGIALNFMSAVRFTRACLPQMVEQQWGRIVNISSTTAKNADPLYPIYGATKAAMLNFTKTISTSFAKDGVRCNAVLPGITLTPLVEQNVRDAVAKTGRTPEEIMTGATKRWPIAVGRFGKPEEIADAVAFLSSDGSDWITGVSLPIDGGTIPTVA